MKMKMKMKQSVERVAEKELVADSEVGNVYSLAAEYHVCIGEVVGLIDVVKGSKIFGQPADGFHPIVIPNLLWFDLSGLKGEDHKWRLCQKQEGRVWKKFCGKGECKRQKCGQID